MHARLARAIPPVLALLLFTIVTPGRAAGLPPAGPVESQPLLAQVRRLAEALDFLGQPLSAPVRQALADAAQAPDDDAVTARIEAALDPLCLGAVTIPGGDTPRFVAAETPPALLEQGWRLVLVKVINPAGATGSLRADSPGARPLPNSPADRVAERWIDVEMINRRPLNPTLSGLRLEYRLLGLWARGPGRHAAEIAFLMTDTGGPASRPDATQRLWNFDGDPEGWQARNQVLLEAREGSLIADSTGSDPFLDTRVEMPRGRFALRFRVRTHTNSIWQLFWWTERHPQPHPARQVAFPVPHHDGLWSEQFVEFETDSPLRGVRIDPGSSPGESAFDWIQLESTDPTGPGWTRATMTFPVEPARPVVFRVSDEIGRPATAAFVVRDAVGRVYPMQSKRLGGDLFFQPQIYRHDGETLPLPDGEYTVDCSRGPESLPEQQRITVGPGRAEIRYRVRRWIDPATEGWYSGDHHIHAAGCLHYNRPEEGVRPEDMQRHIMGEDLKVGCNLTWGPGFDFQKQFFRAGLDPASRPPYLLRYDIEVSGFGSHQSGHLNLLRLRQQMPPGGDSTHHWPTLGLNTLRWAKRQGAVCGPAHSASGLEGRVARIGDGPDGPDGLPSYDVPPYDGIGANEFVVDITHEVPGPDDRPVPAVDFISTLNTTRRAEWNMWYHTLNCGFRVRASGETDFPCITGARVGAGRVYVRQSKALEFDDWVEGLREGRSYVSDGTAHLLDFRAVTADRTLALGDAGSEVRLPRPGRIRFSATAALRQPGRESARVELVVNGVPVQSHPLPTDGRKTPVTFELSFDRSSWVALRIGESAHTNPFFVLVESRPIRASRRSAEWLLAGVDQCWSQKERTYAPSEKDQAREAYEHARQTYRRLIAESPVP